MLLKNEKKKRKVLGKTRGLAKNLSSVSEKKMRKIDSWDEREVK
jgi:hypothetical protein